MSPGQNTEVGNLALLQGNLPNPRIEPKSPALQADSLPAEPPRKPNASLAMQVYHSIHCENIEHPLGYPSGSAVKNLPATARDTGDEGSISGSGRSPAGGKGNPLQYSCLKNPVDRGAWWATVQRVIKSQTRLSD